MASGFQANNSAPQPKPKTYNEALKWSLILFFILIVIFIIVAAIRQAPNAGFGNSAIALSLIGGIAVGIERVLEVFWTVVEQLGKSAWWPLNLVGQFEDFVQKLDAQGKTFYEKAAAAIKTAQNEAVLLPNQIDEASRVLNEVKNNVGTFLSLPPGNQPDNSLSSITMLGISRLASLLPELNAHAKPLNTAISGISDFADTFKNNPGRKLVCIFVGAMLGMIIAGVLGLDLFMAAGSPLSGVVTSLLPGSGIAITGFLIGLGSNPTHEVIKAIQEYKNNASAGRNG